MSSYLPGNTDYIPQIQPFVPDYNFLGNILQTKQSQYDTNKRKVSDLYGTLLNSPLLKDSNIKRRDEFFKVIDQDIKKISGLDLSLEQNVNAAQKVFKSFYDDKYMVTDMVKTKNAYDELEKGNAFKSCTDPVKCGGVFSETSMRAIQYKMQEFKETTDEESLNFEMGKFTPKYLWQKEAIELAAVKGYKMKQDYITREWIVTKSNGDLIQGGLLSIFQSVYGDDPRIAANYADEAYVKRKDFIANNTTQYGSKEKAEEYYIQENITGGLKKINKELSNTSKAFDQLTARELQLKSKNGLSDKDKEILDQVIEDKKTVQATKTKLEELVSNIQSSVDNKDIKNLRYKVDTATAGALEYNDMDKLATSLSLNDSGTTYKENIYNVKAVEFANNRALKSLENYYNEKEMYLKNDLDKNLKQFEHNLDNYIGYENPPEVKGTSPDGGNIVDFNTADNPTAPYEFIEKDNSTAFAKAQNKTLNFIWNLYNKAKKETEGNGNSAGAKQFLDGYFKNGNITNISDLQKNLKNASILDTYNSILKTIPEDKNSTAANAWAQPIINNSRGTITDINLTNTAAASKMTHIQDITKNIINKMKGEASRSKMYLADADLLINNKMAMVAEDAPPKFINDYLKRHGKEGQTESDAERAYENLREDFYPRFNLVKNADLSQGRGLTGSGKTQAEILTFKGLTPNNQTTKNTLKTINNVLNEEGSGSFVLGDASKTNYNDGDNNSDEVKRAFDKISSDLLIKGKDNPLKNITVEFNPIANSSKDLSAITLKNLPTDYIKQLVGTKESKGILFGKDLSKGLTMFYNNKMIQNNFEGSVISDFQTVLLAKKYYTFDQYAANAGIVDYSYNESTGDVDVHQVYNGFKNNKFVKGMIDNTYTIALSQVDESKNTELEGLKNLQIDNLEGFKAQEKKR